MVRLLAGILAALQLLMPQTEALRLAAGLKTGALLRLHVVAEDDTAEMQRVKLCVRDAVRDAYAQNASEGAMLDNARRLLPALTEAATACALQEGFQGEVRVELREITFDARELDGLTVPAGDYPALMVYLGHAQGHNWWGLLDPELALRCAGSEDASAPWDWSLEGFWAALKSIWHLGREDV